MEACAPDQLPGIYGPACRTGKTSEVFIHLHHTFENVRKYLGTALQKAASCLTKGGWNVGHIDIGTGTFHLNASIAIRQIAAPERLTSASAALSNALEELRLS